MDKQKENKNKFDPKLYYIKNRDRILEYNKNYFRNYKRNNIHNKRTDLIGCIIKQNVRVTF